jgi:hypothetical protein
MLGVVGRGVALAGVAVLLAAGCSGSGSESTSTAAGSTSTSPTTNVVLASATTTATTAPPVTLPAGPTVAEAGGWRMVISAPTALATIGPSVDLCYEVTGPAADAKITFEVDLVFSVTGSVVSIVRPDGSVGRGSARLNLGNPDARRYDLTVQGIVNGQPVTGLAVTIRSVLFGAATPAGCP